MCVVENAVTVCLFDLEETDRMETKTSARDRDEDEAAYGYTTAAENESSSAAMVSPRTPPQVEAAATPDKRSMSPSKIAKPGEPRTFNLQFDT